MNLLQENTSPRLCCRSTVLPDSCVLPDQQDVLARAYECLVYAQPLLGHVLHIQHLHELKWVGVGMVVCRS